jgi:putative tryptophan/tyrosine transport system substrate-binding protein
MKRREFLGGVLFAAMMRSGQAQTPANVHHIAIVHPSNLVSEMRETGGAPPYRALFGELRRLGYVEGQNLTVERFSGEGRPEHYAELAREIVGRHPELVVVATTRMVRHFKAATDTIPIVGTMADPVALGVVSSLARPGGNVTGISVDAGLEVWGKRVALLREAIPGASRIGFLASRDVVRSGQGAAMLEAAQRSGISLVGPTLEDTIQEPEYRRVFAAMTQERADALIVSDQAEHFTYRWLIIELAGEHRLPVLYSDRSAVELGGLLSYGADVRNLYRRAAGYIDQILKGAKPGEMPIYQATKFELVINVTAARSIGLRIAPAVLLRADEVIE